MRFNTGDVVRIGRGRVHYGVAYDLGNEVKIVSFNTNKTQMIDPSRLTLVQAVQDVAYEAGCSVEELTCVAPKTEEEAPVKEDTPYQKAVLLALNLKGKHVYAGTVRKNVKAKRRGLGRRQKASRVANR